MFCFSRANLPDDAWHPARVLGDAPRHEQLQGQAPEAVTWRASVAKPEPAKGYAPADQIAFELKSALEYAITTRVDPAIGGDLAVLILERDQPARWFNKPSACND